MLKINRIKNMSQKKIDFICPPGASHWVGDGFLMTNFIPYQKGLSMRDMDPFILLDYGTKIYVKPGGEPKGVGVHPHRGFETVTIAYHGEAEHHDSKGNHGIIKKGDVQWMTAGSGVLHKEYHSKDLAVNGGAFQMVQLWVNLPAKDKMASPTYQALTNAALTKVTLPDGSGVIEVIAGDYKGAKGPAKTFSTVNVMNVKLGKNGKADFSLPASQNTALMAVEGDFLINGVKLPEKNLLKFSHIGTDFTVEGKSETSTLLIISGEPLNEPIASYGPFVMNTEAQIQEAIRDMQTGKFGYLPD